MNNDTQRASKALSHSSKNRGIMFIIMSAFCFATMNTFVKLAGDIPSIQKSFFRNLVAVVFALIILKKNHLPLRWQKGNLPYLLLRSTFGTIGILCNFYAVDHLLLSDASMLSKLSPFFAIIFSFLLLKEKVSLFQGAAIVTAFIGSLFIIKPSFASAAFQPALVGLCGAMGAGCAYTLVRLLSSRNEKGPFIVFFFSSFSCLATLPYLLFSYHPMAPKQLLFLLLAGLAASGGQFAVTAAYSNAPAKEISVYDYSQVVFAAVMGFFLFGQVPDALSFVGYLIICGISILMFLYNNHRLPVAAAKPSK